MNKRKFIASGLTLCLGAASGKLQALEFYPVGSERKWAVVYGTWCGSARDAAVWISEGMGGIAQVFDVRENPDLSAYEFVVIGGAIRGGKVSDELQSYIAKHREMLRPKLRGLFAVCGNRMQPVEAHQKAELIDAPLGALLGAGTDVPSRAFLGRITYSLMDEDSRKMLQGFNMPEYDNLKRSECMDFGKEILSKVR
ncbi:MAG: flavodoxin domain-containing protein [Tannerellaceae bacterium]|nr:flavodoxin domain-containing protein [Tannerellaceae bacterium]